MLYKDYAYTTVLRKEMVYLMEDNFIFIFQIRKQAIKDLPSLCRGRTELVPKVADILAQLLQMEDPAELATVQSSLVSLLKTDTKG